MSLLRRELKSGAALLAVIALAGLAVSGAAVAKPAKSTAKPVVSETFKKDSKETAKQTGKVLATGTSSAAPVDPRDNPLPSVKRDVDGKIIACDDKDPAWKELPEDIRRNARPGECYARLLLAPQTEIYADRVLVTPERVEKRTLPAQYRMVEKEVMVKPERVERRVIPAVVTTRMETEVVREAGFREEVIPARYEVRVEQVMVSPARQEWVRTEGEALDAPLVTPGDHRPVRYREDGYLAWPGKEPVRVETDEEGRRYLEKGNPPSVWCLKDIPAEYRTEKRKVMVEPERVRRIEVPAVTRQVKRQVVERPERVEEYTIPAVYEKQRVKELVAEEQVKTYTVPAVYKDVEKTRVTGRAEGVWRQVICDRNASPKLIMKVQKALAAKGYNPGTIDGNLGPQTVAAVQKFQADNDLPQGQVSIESVQALGIDPIIRD
jgi:hypothetical protein